MDCVSKEWLIVDYEEDPLQADSPNLIPGIFFENYKTST